MLRKTLKRGNYVLDKQRKQRIWRFVVLIAVSVVVLLHRSRVAKTMREFRDAVDNCEGFSTPLNLGNTSSFPPPIPDILLEIDHIFILGFDECVSRLPSVFSGRATCVLGQKLDSCAPKAFIRRPYVHAMKVSFMHAAVLQLARTAQYKHIAIIEDDVEVRHHIFSNNVVDDFHKLLDSSLWSIVRFGYRPYFLEESSRERCPSRCRCRIQKQVAEEFCELPRGGCDLRSSDFYVIHKHFYVILQSKILDLKQPNSKRIVDTRPFRHFSKQWLMLPQASIQTKLDIPTDYQIGLGALFIKKCVYPRPITRIVAQQFLTSWSTHVSNISPKPIRLHTS